MTEWKRIPSDKLIDVPADANGDKPFLVWDKTYDRPEIVRQMTDLSLWWGDWQIPIEADFYMLLPERPE